MSDQKPSIPPCMLPLVTRRSLLKGAAATAAIAPLAVACGNLPGEINDAKRPENKAPESIDFDLSSDDFKALADIGGMACANALAFVVVLVRASDDEILAFNNSCTHQNLPIGPCGSDPDKFDTANPLMGTWDASSKTLTCKYHTSVFNSDGTVNSGPAPSPLPTYQVTFDKMAGTGTIKLS